MDPLVYEQYLAEWSTHKSLEMIFPISETITEPILKDLYQTYHDFKSKNRSCKINLIQEKFVYDRQMRRHGFQSMFEVKDSKGNLENIKLTTYIRTQSQQIIHDHRKQFQEMAIIIFGTKHKLGVKIRCDSKSRRFQFILRIIN